MISVQRAVGPPEAAVRLYASAFPAEHPIGEMAALVTGRHPRFAELDP